MSEPDALVVAELTMAAYAQWVADEIAAMTLERVTGDGGGWGDDSALYGELLRMRVVLAEFPPTEWARRLIERGADE